MRLWRANSLGNDYLVWIGPSDFLRPDHVSLICDRRFGVGSDGILEPLGDVNGEHMLRIWNPDGSIAEKSGNGLRIFTRWLWEQTHRQHRFFHLNTGFESAVGFIESEDKNVAVDMGVAQFEPQSIPSTQSIWNLIEVVNGIELRLFAVGMGNPHCVCFLASENDLERLDWPTEGRRLEGDPRFPNKTNVQFAVVLDRKTIVARIWERGAGITEASGSSASAIFSAAEKMGWVDSTAIVRMPGGNMTLRLDHQRHVFNEAPVSSVGIIELTAQFAKNF